MDRSDLVALGLPICTSCAYSFEKHVRESKRMHAFMDAPARPVAKKTKAGVKHRFQNPYGEGDICAAGILPYFFDEQHNVSVVLQIEEKAGERSLAAFGGKVEKSDSHWCETAFREFQEETGELLHMDTVALLKNARFESDVSETKYIAKAKFQMLFVQLARDHVEHMRDLIAAYALAYGGRVERGRSGERLIIVSVDALPLVDGERLNLRPELSVALQTLRRKNA
eukprot:TRINITY_DN19199_c0_g1_i1.p1 TRINITY_DN19199_c0_g1~~TRINITY_DN19199_c0_g1_i1.p1  ORF type:complete len:226 (-),score=29.45 TRINITY_DN19199_c0_g1_i1:355-1032(-)